MDNKRPSHVSGKQNLLTRRINLSYGLLKRESDQKTTIQDNKEKDARLVWNGARAKLTRRTSAPAELPLIKDALPKLSMKPRTRTLSLRGENSETHVKQWSASKSQINANVCQNKNCEHVSTSCTSVKGIHTTEKDPEQRPSSGLTNNSNSISMHGFVLTNKNISLNPPRQLIKRKCLTQEAIICHELGYAETEEDASNQKKHMIVRWLNSEALNSGSRPFPQL